MNHKNAKRKEKKMITRDSSIVLSILLGMVAISYAELDGRNCNEKYFEFYEKSSISRPADIGTMTLKIKSENESFKKAIEENEKQRESLIASIKKSGIEKNNIKTANYSSIPVLGIFSRKTKKHKIENRIDVIIRNENELAKVANVVDVNEKVEYVGIKFSLENEDSLKAELRQIVFKNVKKRQKEIEDSFQVKLNLVGYKEIQVNDVQYFDSELKKKSMAYGMILREQAAPEAAFNSLKIDAGILFTFKITE